jgi:sec-independent protein translocase protein TatA
MPPLLAMLTNPLGLIVILVVVLLLFGNRLPQLMRSLGRSVVEFKKGVNELEDDSDKGSQGRS